MVLFRKNFHLVQRIEVQKKKVSQDFLETKHLENRLIFLKPRFLARDVVELYFGGNLRGSLVKIFLLKKLPGETLCKLV